MFCSNCGKDCRNENFCSNCGRELCTSANTQASTERSKSLDLSGKAYCPKCFSTSITINSADEPIFFYRSILPSLLQLIKIYSQRASEKVRGQECICIKCGHRWYTKDLRGAKLDEKHRDHLSELFKGKMGGMYRTPNEGFLHFKETGMVIHHSVDNECFVPYRQIVAVHYHETQAPLYGWLTIRYAKNNHMPFPATFPAAQNDATTVFYFYSDADVFLKIFNILKVIAEENSKIELG